MKASSIIADVVANSIAKLNPSMVGCMAKYVINQGGEEYIDELVLRWSRHVNPNELRVTPQFFENITQTFGKTFVLTVLTATKIEYTTEGAKINTRPMPDMAQFFSKNDMINYLKNQPFAEEIEGTLKNIRLDYEPNIAKRVGHTSARMELEKLEMNLVRIFGRRRVGFVSRSWQAADARRQGLLRMRSETNPTPPLGSVLVGSVMCLHHSSQALLANILRRRRPR